jgi:hypothetical protein
MQGLDHVDAIDRNPFARRLAKPAILKPGLAVVPKCRETSSDPPPEGLPTDEIKTLRKGPNAAGRVACSLNRTYRALAIIFVQLLEKNRSPCYTYSQSPDRTRALQGAWRGKSGRGEGRYFFVFLATIR